METDRISGALVEAEINKGRREVVRVWTTLRKRDGNVVSTATSRSPLTRGKDA